MTLALRYAVRSDVGLLREGNEDAAYAGPHLLAVADGMGGYEAGEVASASVISSVAPLDRDPMPESDLADALSAAVTTAKDRLRGIVDADPSVGSMGTTLTAMLWSGATAAICHIGDSRAYLLRGGELYQVTRDHTFVQALVDQGRIRPEEASTHPQRSLLLRALDGRTDADPDLSLLTAEAGDRFLLCSDGLPVVVSDELILQALSEVAEPADVVQRLIDLAIRGGGPDNITCIVADVIDTADGRLTPTFAPVVAGAAANAEANDTRPITKSAIDGQGGMTRIGPLPASAAAEPAAATGGPAHMGGGSPSAQAMPGPSTAARTTVPGRAQPGPSHARSRQHEQDARSHPPAAGALPRRRWPLMTSVVALFVLLIGAGLAAGYEVLVKNQYYVGTDRGDVVIFRGLDQTVFGMSLSGIYQRTPIAVSLVPAADLQGIHRASSGSLAQAQRFVANIRTDTCQAADARLAQWKAGKPKPYKKKKRLANGKFVTVTITPPYHKPKPTIPAFCPPAPT